MTKTETVTLLANITMLMARYPMASQLEIRSRYHDQYGTLYSHSYIGDLIRRVRDATAAKCVEIRDHDYRIIANNELNQVTEMIHKVHDAYDKSIAAAESDHAARWYSQYLGLCGRRQEILEDMLIFSVDTAGSGARGEKDTVGGASSAPADAAPAEGGDALRAEKPELITTH